MRVVIETCVSTAKHGAKDLLILNWHEGNIPSLAIAAESLHRDHGMSGAHRAGLLRRRGALRPLLRRPHARRRDRGAGGARAPARPRASRPHRLLVRPQRTATRWTSCGARAAISRCCTDIRSIAADRLVRQPAARHRRQRARACSTDIADAIAREAREIFRQLDAVQGGTAEIKQLRQVVLMARLLKQSEAKTARPARPHLARAGVGRDRLARQLPHRRDRRAASRAIQPRGPHLHRRLRGMHLRASRAAACTRAESGEHRDQAGRHRSDPAEREAHDAQHRHRAAGAAVLLPGARRVGAAPPNSRASESPCPTAFCAFARKPTSRASMRCRPPSAVRSPITHPPTRLAGADEGRRRAGHPGGRAEARAGAVRRHRRSSSCRSPAPASTGSIRRR